MQFGVPYAEQMHNNPLQYTEAYANNDASDKWGGGQEKIKEQTITNTNFKRPHVTFQLRDTFIRHFK